MGCIHPHGCAGTAVCAVVVLHTQKWLHRDALEELCVGMELGVSQLWGHKSSLLFGGFPAGCCCCFANDWKQLVAVRPNVGSQSVGHTRMGKRKAGDAANAAVCCDNMTTVATVTTGHVLVTAALIHTLREQLMAMMALLGAELTRK